jgi:hypothetical protein
MNPAIVRSYRVFFALLTFAAVAYQLTVTAANGYSLANFFSYFTIDSNLLAAAVLTVLAVRSSPPTALADWWRGLAVVCMAITGVVFNLLLRTVDVQTIGWVNDVVHVIMPVALMLDWMTVPARDPIAWPAALRWLLFPSLWLAYTLVRGAVTGWYPYPFLDVPVAGAATVAGVCVAIAAGFVVTIAVVRTIGNRRVPAPAAAR